MSIEGKAKGSERKDKCARGKGLTVGSLAMW